jgi:hypothetical protein
MYPKIHLETQETANSQGNTQQKRVMLAVSQYPTKLYYKAIAVKNSMVLAQKQT